MRGTTGASDAWGLQETAARPDQCATCYLVTLLGHHRATGRPV